MAKFCINCGAQLEDDAQFCPSCGASQQGQAQPQGQPQYQAQPQGQPQYQQQTYQQPQTMAVRKPAAGDHTAEYDPEEIKREKAITIVSYLGWVAIIPYVTKKDSSYARFHIVQAMYLFLLQIVCAVLAAILSGLGALAVMLLTNWFGVVLMVLMNLLSFALNVGCLVFVIMGLVYAGKGKAKDLPMFNKLRGLGWLK